MNIINDISDLNPTRALLLPVRERREAQIEASLCGSTVMEDCGWDLESTKNEIIGKMCGNEASANYCKLYIGNLLINIDSVLIHIGVTGNMFFNPFIV